MSEVRDNMFAYMQALVDFLSVDTGLSKQEVLDIVRPAIVEMRECVESSINRKKSDAAITAAILDSLKTTGEVEL